jgi:hypothetical protein
MKLPYFHLLYNLDYLLEKFDNIYNYPCYITYTFEDISDEEEYDSINDDYLNDKLNKNLKKK